MHALRRTPILLAAVALLAAVLTGSTGIASHHRPSSTTAASSATGTTAPVADALPAAAKKATKTVKAKTSAKTTFRPKAYTKHPYKTFRHQAKKQPWWNQASGINDAEWTYPYFPSACYQADTAHGGTKASAWQVLWVTPDNKPDNKGAYQRTIRLSVRAAQSIFAASARRYVPNQRALFSHSLAPRFVTTSTCQPDIRSVRVPASVYNTGHDWNNDGNSSPFGDGTLTEWLLDHGYNAPNRKYLVLLPYETTYDHWWAGISEDLAAGAGAGHPDETPTRDNPANYTSFSYIEAADLIYPHGNPWVEAGDAAQTIAHEMTHSMGAMTESAPHDNPANALHPTDCWDILCYNPPTQNQTYTNACGKSNGWKPQQMARAYMRLDCGRDDYWAPATDTGLKAATWTSRRWAVSSSSFLYGNPQPTAAQLAAHQR